MEALHTMGAQASLRAIRHAEYLLSEKYQSQQWRANRQGAHPDILEFEKRFVREAAKLGVPVFAHNMVRTKAEQDALFAGGVTKAEGGRSPHNYGLAVDIVHGILAWGLLKPQWDILGHLGEEIGRRAGIDIEWGGRWSGFYDPAHWQLRDWRKHHQGFPFAAESNLTCSD